MTTVVCLYSLSFTGTSYINVLLGCHPLGFALGPADKLYPDSLPIDRPCIIHNKDCRFWPGFFNNCNLEGNLLIQLSDYAGKEFIVVNNPNPERIGKHIGHRSIRHVSIAILREGRAVAVSYSRNMKKTIEEGIDWVAFHSLALHKRIHDGGWPVYRYEDINDNPNFILKNIGNKLGINYPDNAEKYWEFEHHLRGGNAGMLYMIQRFQRLPTIVQRSKEHEQFYEKQFMQLLAGKQVSFIDNRWMNLWTADHEKHYHKVCGEFYSSFGYLEPGKRIIFN